MLSIERIFGRTIDPGSICDDSEFVYASFDDAVSDVSKLNPIAKSHGFEIGFWVSSLNIRQYGKEDIQGSKDADIVVKKWVDGYGIATIIEIRFDSKEFSRRISVDYVDITKIPTTLGIDISSPSQAFRHLHFNAPSVQPVEGKFDENLPMADLPTILEIAISKLDLSLLSYMIRKEYALVEKTSNGEAIIKRSNSPYTDKFVKKELTPKRFERYLAGEIYSVQIKGAGRNRIEADCRGSTSYVQHPRPPFMV